ncbi:hypothetical protein [Methylocaldum szegediense]|uniref:hypothetical protein n=1 Tax=Methylocaldum szegediense TaxID=73780 RepID=UPI0003FF5110|nr:hypothetical protein [Methylocaldum szegediense]
MLPYYAHSAAVTLKIPFWSDAEVDATPISGRYQLLDGIGMVLLDWTPLVIQDGDVEVCVTLAAELNQLDAGQPRAARELRYELTLPSGALIQKSILYAIGNVSEPSILVNSFQSYASAMMVADDLPQLSGHWHIATDRQRKIALIDAYARLIKVRFKNLSGNGAVIAQSGHVIENESLGRIDLSTFSVDEFLALPEKFLSALYRAQVLQADDILGADPIQERRKAGLMSETVGESSNMYRPGTPIMWQMSRRALEALSDYLDYRMIAGRA